MRATDATARRVGGRRGILPVVITSVLTRYGAAGHCRSKDARRRLPGGAAASGLSIFVGFVSSPGARTEWHISVVAAPGVGFALASIGFVSPHGFEAFRDRGTRVSRGVRRDWIWRDTIRGAGIWVTRGHHVCATSRGRSHRRGPSAPLPIPVRCVFGRTNAHRARDNRRFPCKTPDLILQFPDFPRPARCAFVATKAQRAIYVDLPPS
jgi:hypothetical protein